MKTKQNHTFDSKTQKNHNDITYKEKPLKTGPPPFKMLLYKARFSKLLRARTFSRQNRQNKK